MGTPDMDSMIKTDLLIAGALVVGIVLGMALTELCWRAQSRGKRSGRRKPETMKLVIWVCLLNGIAWVWCSYLLAWMDKLQIAESLSQVAVTEIIGVVLASAIKSAVENLSKNNSWPDKSKPPDGGTGR